MKASTYLPSGLTLILIPTVWAQVPQAGKVLTWAYPVPDQTAAGAADTKPKTIPGSSLLFTQAQIDHQFNPPDWFPNEHGHFPRWCRKEFRRRPAALAT